MTTTTLDMDKMVPEIALQMAMEHKMYSVADCSVYQLTEEWQEQILVQSKYASIAHTLAELEKVLGDEDPACVVLPDDCAITNETLKAVLSRNSADKTILWGVPAHV